jgi:hypothetical protein
MAPEADEYVVDFPTLWIVPDWIERHCLMPSAMAEPAPLDVRLAVVVHRQPLPGEAGRVACGDAEAGRVARLRRCRVPESPFADRGGAEVGKGPWSASIICAEAVGPVVFCGFAAGGETYRCSDYGCGCGWEYEYEPGRADGKPWVRPLIQLLATSEDQTDNVYAPLQTMIRAGR